MDFVIFTNDGKYPSDSSMIQHVGVIEVSLAVTITSNYLQLNPFDSYTDGALFSWDSPIFKNGPFTVRCITHETIEHKMTWWRKIINDYTRSTDEPT